MRTRTCSHKIYEIYSEIILKEKFSKKYSLLETKSDYYAKFHCSIFTDNSFRRKLLVVEKSSDKIIFENINDNSFIVFNNILTDDWVYSIDADGGFVTKLRNPYLWFTEGDNIDYEFRMRFLSILLSDNVLEVSLVDDFLCFGLQLKTLCSSHNFQTQNPIAEWYDGSSTYTSIDKFFQDSNYRFLEALLLNYDERYRLIGKSTILFVIDTRTGKQTYREMFPHTERLIISSCKIKKKNCILIEHDSGGYDQDFPTEGLIDLDKNKFLELTYPGLTLFSDNYFLTVPSFSFDYYDVSPVFSLFRVSDFQKINLKETILPIMGISLEEVSNSLIELTNDGQLKIDDFEFSCHNLFSGVMNATSYDYNKNVHSCISINSNLYSGYALSTHTIKSTLLPNGNFETLRTEIGEQLYQLKYNFKRQMILPLAKIASEAIMELFGNIDLILPIPPTNLNRPFQPVIELALEICKQTGIKCDATYLKKTPTPAIKSIEDEEVRKNTLENAFFIPNNHYKGKTVLLFDDLYRSGDTLNAAAKVLKEQGEVGEIFVLTITKTKTKR